MTESKIMELFNLGENEKTDFRAKARDALAALLAPPSVIPIKIAAQIIRVTPRSLSTYLSKVDPGLPDLEVAERIRQFVVSVNELRKCWTAALPELQENAALKAGAPTEVAFDPKLRAVIIDESLSLGEKVELMTSLCLRLALEKQKSPVEFREGKK